MPVAVLLFPVAGDKINSIRCSHILPDGIDYSGFFLRAECECACEISDPLASGRPCSLVKPEAITDTATLTILRLFFKALNCAKKHIRLVFSFSQGDIVLAADRTGGIEATEILICRADIGIIEIPSYLIHLSEQMDNVGGAGSATDVKEQLWHERTIIVCDEPKSFILI